jgi:hypothetical protein
MLHQELNLDKGEGAAEGNNTHCTSLKTKTMERVLASLELARNNQLSKLSAGHRRTEKRRAGSHIANRHSLVWALSLGQA